MRKAFSFLPFFLFMLVIVSGFLGCVVATDYEWFNNGGFEGGTPELPRTPYRYFTSGNYIMNNTVSHSGNYSIGIYSDLSIGMTLPDLDSDYFVSMSLWVYRALCGEEINFYAMAVYNDTTYDYLASSPTVTDFQNWTLLTFSGFVDSDKFLERVRFNKASPFDQMPYYGCLIDDLSFKASVVSGYAEYVYITLPWVEVPNHIAFIVLFLVTGLPAVVLSSAGAKSGWGLQGLLFGAFIGVSAGILIGMVPFWFVFLVALFVLLFLFSLVKKS